MRLMRQPGIFGGPGYCEGRLADRVFSEYRHVSDLRKPFQDKGCSGARCQVESKPQRFGLASRLT